MQKGLLRFTDYESQKNGSYLIIVPLTALQIDTQRLSGPQNYNFKKTLSLIILNSIFHPHIEIASQIMRPATHIEERPLRPICNFGAFEREALL